MKVHVEVLFVRTVEVEVPSHLSPAEQTVLAEKLALAQILATSTNPDFGEALEAACEEFSQETSGTESDFNQSKIVGIGGVWTARK